MSLDWRGPGDGKGVGDKKRRNQGRGKPSFEKKGGLLKREGRELAGRRPR